MGRAVTEAGSLPGGQQSLPGAGDTWSKSCQGRGLSQEWERGSIPASSVAAPDPAGDRPPNNQLSSVGKAQTRKPRLRVAEGSSEHVRQKVLEGGLSHCHARAKQAGGQSRCPYSGPPPPGRSLCDLWVGGPVSPPWGGVTPFPHLVFPLASDATKETPPFHGRKRGCRVKRAERALELAEPLLTVTSSRSFHQ